MGYVEGCVKTYRSGAAIGQYLRVALVSGLLQLAGASQKMLGTTEEEVFAASEPQGVRLVNCDGTRYMVANGAISSGAPVYAAASGKIASSGTVLEGYAQGAATADGDVIEVLGVQSGGPGGVLNVRQRFTIAQVNVGATLLAAVPGLKYRLIEASAISVGGAAGAVTTVDILATQATASVKLVAFAQASLTQNTQLKSGGSGAAILAAGASYVQNDVNTAITVGKTGSDVTTATHIDVIASYVLEG